MGQLVNLQFVLYSSGANFLLIVDELEGPLTKESDKSALAGHLLSPSMGLRADKVVFLQKPCDKTFDETFNTSVNHFDPKELEGADAYVHVFSAPECQLPQEDLGHCQEELVSGHGLLCAADHLWWKNYTQSEHKTKFVIAAASTSNIPKLYEVAKVRPHLSRYRLGAGDLDSIEQKDVEGLHVDWLDDSKKIGQVRDVEVHVTVPGAQAPSDALVGYLVRVGGLHFVLWCGEGEATATPAVAHSALPTLLFKAGPAPAKEDEMVARFLEELGEGLNLYHPTFPKPVNVVLARAVSDNLIARVFSGSLRREVPSSGTAAIGLVAVAEAMKLVTNGGTVNGGVRGVRVDFCHPSARDEPLADRITVSCRDGNRWILEGTVKRLFSARLDERLAAW